MTAPGLSRLAAMVTGSLDGTLRPRRRSRFDPPQRQTGAQPPASGGDMPITPSLEAWPRTAEAEPDWALTAEPGPEAPAEPTSESPRTVPGRARPGPRPIAARASRSAPGVPPTFGTSQRTAEVEEQASTEVTVVPSPAADEVLRPIGPDEFRTDLGPDEVVPAIRQARTAELLPRADEMFPEPERVTRAKGSRRGTAPGGRVTGAAVASGPADEPEVTVHVSIGRLEVRLTEPEAAPAARPVRRRGLRSLQDYEGVREHRR